MSEAIIKYQVAIAEMKAAKLAAHNLVATVERAVKILGRDWQTVTITNVTPQFPNQLSVENPHRSFSGSEWPTAEQLASALCRYHAARASLQTAFMQIPSSERTAVKPPTDWH